MMERLFPSCENTGCISSSADVPDICDCGLEPKHDTLCLLHCWLKTSTGVFNCYRFIYLFKKGTKILLLHSGSLVKSHRLQLFLLLVFLPYLQIKFVSVGIYWEQIQWRQDWLVVSGSIEQNYNYLLLHLVMWPPVPGVNLLLSPVSAQPNTAKLLKWGQRSGLGKA